MALKKLFLKIKLFINSKVDFLSKLLVISTITILSYMFINSIVFEKVIFNNANNSQVNNKCNKALMLYNVAYFYYGINHFSKTNKDIYFEIPYKMSLCYLKKGDQKNSSVIMLDITNKLQQQYGIYSSELAEFIRKYLAEYYLETNNIPLAQLEFNNLLIIYKKIGYDNNITADLIRLNGDIYYQQKDYDNANICYEKAYSLISAEKDIDYEVFSKIVDRICDYEVEKSNSEEAINIYKSSINVLKNAGTKQPELIAGMLMRQGDLYAQNDQQLKEAINCYKEATGIIKKLPKKTFLRQNIITYLTTLKDLYNRSNLFHEADEVNMEITRQRRFAVFILF